MSKKRSHITKVNAGPIVPSWMAEDEAKGTESLIQYIIPPRIKIVQKASDSDLLERFNPGDVIIVPSNTMICAMGMKGGKSTGESVGFSFTPLFFFPEYCAWNPIQLKGQVPAIRERSFDPQSQIALNSRNANTRMQPHPDYDDMKIRFVEHLNFMVYMQGLEEAAVLSFSRAAHTAGRSFCSLIRLRRAPIYGCMFQATVVHKKNAQGDWWEIAVENPATEQWIEESQYADFKQKHEEFTEAHQKAMIRPDYGDDNKTGETPVNTEY